MASYSPREHPSGEREGPCRLLLRAVSDEDRVLTILFAHVVATVFLGRGFCWVLGPNADG